MTARPYSMRTILQPCSRSAGGARRRAPSRGCFLLGSVAVAALRIVAPAEEHRHEHSGTHQDAHRARVHRRVWKQTASEAAAATRVDADMPANISTVCLQGCRRMHIQATIPSAISSVITSAEASGDRDTRSERARARTGRTLRAET